MTNPDRPEMAQGHHLDLLVEEVRREFEARDPCETFDQGWRQVNSVRVVTSELFEELSIEAKLAVMSDLLSGNEEILLSRPVQEVFEASDSPGAYITDVACEVVWQTLMQDPAVQMEDEARQATAGY